MASIIHIADKDYLEEAASRVLETCKNAKVFAFYGEMGAGKTTLIKALSRQLGSDDSLSSPTFSIVNEYRDADGNPIYHMDLYRLKNLEEAEEIGVEEYLHSGHYCFIEWPELIEPILPDDAVHLLLETSADESRKLTIQSYHNGRAK